MPIAEPARSHLWIIGPGRVGIALGTALLDVQPGLRLSYAGRHPERPDDLLFSRAGVEYVDLSSDLTIEPGAGVVVTVPDSAIGSVADRLAAAGWPVDVPVLHTSGALGLQPFEPLASRGHPIGSMHPLAAIPGGGRGASRLRGAWFAVEGDVRARRFAAELVRVLSGRMLRVDTGSKAIYHAAGVFASNYLVTLLATAEHLFVQAGIDPQDARAALGGLARGALENATEHGPAEALTGPIARGDTETVALHIERLSPPERALYSSLARATLELARGAGLGPSEAATIRSLLETDP